MSMYTVWMQGFLSEPGFTGFQDFQDLSLRVYIPFQRINGYFCKGTFGYQTPNPGNPVILLILVQTKEWAGM